MNTYQFSAAKSAAEFKTLQSLVYDEGKLRPYADFYKDAIEKVGPTFRDWWLRIERDNAQKCAVNGEMYRRYEADKDLYPYWMFVESGDDKECEECHGLNGKIFRIGDGEEIWPPIHFNCGCSVEQVDDQYLKENNKKAEDEASANELLDKYVDEGFRFNPGIQGIMPNTGSYFDVLKDANALDAVVFDIPKVKDILGQLYEQFD